MGFHLRIPTVTPDDLQAFRARTFKDIPTNSNTYESFEEGEEEDDLGYYPDGVKRTLTDDQIAMFRHSEIYAIIRERQLRKENAAAETDQVQSSTLEATVILVAGGQEALEEGMKGNSDDDEEEEYARFLETEQRQMQAEAARKNKRKRGKADRGDDRGRRPTMRRIAREMDEAVTSDTVLDYGEEDAPCETVVSPQPNLDEMNGRKRVSYEDELLSPMAAKQKPAIEGRKIWWPIIGGSR